ncbi:hypothetical protein H920_01061 [Fukomys damarensis]|uniref:Uncharacterized protein n=1 Tax=Fukomys damarensis TaxID=885580 RepID=A0A091EPG4_FUKDA|nr:hypothetical protein H920_01061 [Fukomys damarensis]
MMHTAGFRGRASAVWSELGVCHHAPAASQLPSAPQLIPISAEELGNGTETGGGRGHLAGEALDSVRVTALAGRQSPQDLGASAVAPDA